MAKKYEVLIKAGEYIISKLFIVILLFCFLALDLTNANIALQTAAVINILIASKSIT